MKLKVEKPDKSSGILYLLEIDVEGKRVAKIGITSRTKVEDRVIEILLSYFKGHREFPYCRPKRFSKVDDYETKEAWMLDCFKEYKVEVEKKFGGCSELVDVDLDILVSVYEDLKKDIKIPEENFSKCPVCGKDKKFTSEVDGVKVKTCGYKCEIKSTEVRT